MNTPTNKSSNATANSITREKSASRDWWKSGTPWVWLNAGAVSISILLVVGLLVLIGWRGLVHFWPAQVMLATYQEPGGERIRTIGEVTRSETVAAERLREAGLTLDSEKEEYQRILLKVGNRDLLGGDFRYQIDDWLVDRSYPTNLLVVERREWGNLYGSLDSVNFEGREVSGEAAWQAFQAAEARAQELHAEIRSIEKDEIGSVNYQLERLRLKERGRELDGLEGPFEDIEAQRKTLNDEYAVMQTSLVKLYEANQRDSFTVTIMDGQSITVPFAKVVRGYRPNSLNVLQKTGLYFERLWEFVADEPREANTEGGIFPAIFGTVMMVMLMSVFVTPFGVVAALYLREYAKQGVLTRTIRIAVNNLAGVPSIVYGVFGLGFFVYFLGGSIDDLFFREAQPAPTFGTPGLLWASLTLALLTLPVVIVATEEGLARIPRSIREASLALGATKAETLWRVVLPMASPAMMTGLILAIARAAGEVAPLMLVGVVKLAPSLPLDGNFPFMHLDRKFMHLGFHIYDVGFQSPNVEAARPLVYATAFLLVLVIVVLNLAAVRVRNRLREKYRALEH